MLKEFKEFAIKGNAVDLAVGVIMGAAFGAVVTSLVNDVIMPPIGALLGGADFSSLTITVKGATTTTAAVTVNYGMFINAVINLVIIAWVVFLIVKGMNRLRRPAEVSTKECPFCKTEVALAATKCPACTSGLEA